MRRRVKALGCVLYLVCAGARAKAPFDGGTGCCPIGDLAVFEQLHVVAAHRRTAAAWFECAQLRVPAVLLHIADAECEAACKDGECRDGECNATIKKQERRLLQAIGTGTRLKIVRHSAALHLLHSTSSDIGRNATGAYADGKPLSFMEAGRIVECRPSKTTGVVYVLWNVAECDLETRRMTFNALSLVRDLRTSVGSVRASRHGHLLGITLMMQRSSSCASFCGSGEQALQAVLKSNHPQVADFSQILNDLLSIYFVDIRDIPDAAGLRDYGWKMQAMRWSPYDYTLSLDADTFVCAHSLADIWRLTQRFDFVATHAPFFFYEGHAPSTRAGEWDESARLHSNLPGFNTDMESQFGVPDSFVQFNTAVVGFARNSRVEKMLARAVELSHVFQSNGFLDQAFLRQAIWDSPEVLLYVLPSTWQCRAALDCEEVQAQNFNSGQGHNTGVSWQPCHILHTRSIINLTLPHLSPWL